MLSTAYLKYFKFNLYSNELCIILQEMEEEFILVRDFEDEDGNFYLNKAERVKVLKTDDNDPTL